MMQRYKEILNAPNKKAGIFIPAYNLTLFNFATFG